MLVFLLKDDLCLGPTFVLYLFNNNKVKQLLWTYLGSY
jgi:hypothetical protein